MMMKKIAVVLLLVFSAVLPLAAATQPFRSGEILAAELSTVKPQITNEDPEAFPLDFTRRIYAALVVKAAEGRGLSIHDYALEAFGRSYPCIALRIGDAGYDAETWKVERAAGNEKYTLLFVLDATMVGFAQTETLQLRSLFPPKARSGQPVVFSNLNGRSFTSPRSIPADGILKKAGER